MTAASHLPAPPDPDRTDPALANEMTLMFIEAAPDAVIVSDVQGQIVFGNQQAVQTFGYAREELLTLSIDALLPERFHARHSQHRAGYYSEMRLRPMGMGIDLFARRKDGSEFPVEISLSPLLTPRGQRVVASVRDITVRKRLEAELLASQRETDRLRDEFIAIAAHELRNPLAALRGFAEMLQTQSGHGHGPALAEWQREAIEVIDQSSLRLVELTDDLLDVTRLQAGKLSLQLTSHDLVALTRRVLTRQQSTTQRHTLTLTVARDPLRVQLDALRFEQVLNNLLHNAIKYSPDGGLITVIITVTDDATLRISVTDTGIGIPAADQERIFTRFARAENAHYIGGTGLGLYLCHALVTLHHGEIGFTSQENVGSTFWVVLPLPTAAPPPTTEYIVQDGAAGTI